MSLRGEQVLLRVYVRSTDQYHYAPVFERIVQEATKRKMAGATVLKGIYGFGSEGEMRGSEYTLASSVPVIVEIVDRGAAVAEFVRETLGVMLTEGMVTLERAAVLMYRPGQGGGGGWGGGGGGGGGGGENIMDSVQLELREVIEPLSTLPAIESKGNMKASTDGVLLRVFIGESDMHEGQPLFKAIVHKARELGLKGATVLRGSMGFGANTVLHTSKVLELSTDLPIVIELVDSREKIEALVPYLEGMVKEGLITMEHVRVLMYRHDPADAGRKG